MQNLNGSNARDVMEKMNWSGMVAVISVNAVSKLKNWIIAVYAMTSPANIF